MTTRNAGGTRVMPRFKPGISKAKRMVMANRMPIATLVEKQSARIAKLDDRIETLIAKRDDEQRVLAELITMELTLEARNDD